VPENPPKLRADARRNRERLIETAREAFARDGAEASLDDIAKQSGLGSATLYRHYPTRELLIQAVYQRQLEVLAASGDELAASKTPKDALRCWMLTLVDHVLEKRIISSALNESAYENARVLIQGTMDKIVQRGIESGELRSDTVPSDLLRAMIGILQVQGPELEGSARRLVETLIRGASATET
jgi:AcrR family transcriptional regulator